MTKIVVRQEKIEGWGKSFFLVEVKLFVSNKF